ncbi:MAG: SulP family inorganic anion transporter [Flavobacteriales bacterium]|nr:SulP family inorganic anion transporter [Flavobacteriales bacterium]
MNIKSIKASIKGDFTGGLTAAIIALPMALAFGLQSGLGAEYGLYTAIILAIIASLIAGTKTLISDPTGPMTIVAATIIASAGFANNPETAWPTIIATFALAGLFQIVFGFVKVAQYVKYISYPVLSGFMGGIGVIIILFQWHSFFGTDRPGGILEIIGDIHNPILSPNSSSLILGCSTLALIYLIPLLSKKIPAGLIALIIGTLISLSLEPGTFSIIGEIPSSLPEFEGSNLTNFNFNELSSVIVGALTLAGLGTIDTLLTSVVADNVTKTKHNGNRELVGQGLGNFVSALFGGIPGAGSTTGTVANIKSNGTSNISGIIKGLILLIVLLGLGQYLKNVPIPVLSALLISVGIGIIDFKGMKRLIKIKNSDTLVLILVIILTVFADLLVAVGVGMVLSSFFFMQRMGELVDQQSKQGNLADIEKKLKIPEKIKDKIYDFELDGPLFYGFSDQFKEQAEAIKDKDAVIINMSHVPYIDASGIYVLEEVITSFKDKNMDVILVGVKDHIFKQFEDLKVIPQTLPEEKAYNSIRSGLKYLKNQLEHKL